MDSGNETIMSDESPESVETDYSRRRTLQLSGLAAVGSLTALAGCGDEGPGNESADEDNPDETGAEPEEEPAQPEGEDPEDDATEEANDTDEEEDVPGGGGNESDANESDTNESADNETADNESDENESDA